jgi:hypothetical protein
MRHGSGGCRQRPCNWRQHSHVRCEAGVQPDGVGLARPQPRWRRQVARWDRSAQPSMPDLHGGAGGGEAGAGPLRRGGRAHACVVRTDRACDGGTEERRTNPAAATFAFLLDSGAVVGHLMTADAVRFNPTAPAAMSSDPAELPPNTQKYHPWLLSNVGDPATVHDSQEAYRRAMRQPTVSGPDTTWLPLCASCGLCTPSLQVAERRLTTRRVLAFSVDEAVEFAASPPLRQLVASPLAVGESRCFLHPELVTVRLPHSAGATGAGAAPDAASAGLAPPPAWRARVDGALGMTAASAPPAATTPDLAFAGIQNAATGGRAGGWGGRGGRKWPRPGRSGPWGLWQARAVGSAHPPPTPRLLWPSRPRRR